MPKNAISYEVKIQKPCQLRWLTPDTAAIIQQMLQFLTSENSQSVALVVSEIRAAQNFGTDWWVGINIMFPILGHWTWYWNVDNVTYVVHHNRSYSTTVPSILQFFVGDNWEFCQCRTRVVRRLALVRWELSRIKTNKQTKKKTTKKKKKKKKKPKKKKKKKKNQKNKKKKKKNQTNTLICLSTDGHADANTKTPWSFVLAS